MSTVGGRVPLSESAAEQYVAETAFVPGPGFVGASVDVLLGQPDLPGSLVTALALRPPLRHGYLTARSGRLMVVSGPPSPGLDVCLQRMSQDMAMTDVLLNGGGAAVVDQAADTVHPADTPADELLCQRTAGVRVCLDAGDSSQSLRRRWKVAHAVAPVLAAAFAHSPLCDGRPTGWRSTRQAIRLRSASAPPATPPTGDPRTAWVVSALGAPAAAAGSDGWTFRQWLRAGDRRRPTLADLQRHLDFLRPPVAAHGHLEIDVADRQPGAGWRVPLAVTAILVDDARAAEQALAATEGLHQTSGLWERAARHGLADAGLAAAARDCFLTAYGALARRDIQRELRNDVADFIERYVMRGRCPADDVLERTGTRPLQ